MKDNLKPIFIPIIEGFKQEGLDLSSDTATFTITYPEHPEVRITINIGGMFYEEPENMEIH